MIKKLGIFGDSFAMDSRIAFNPYRYKGWSARISEIYGDDQVGIHAQGGASLQWIYREFLENYQNYQQILFFVTAHTRLHIPMKYKHRNGQWALNEHWWGLDTVDLVRQNAAEYDRTLVEMIEKYFVYMKDDHTNFQHEITRMQATIFHVKHLCPKAIIIPGFRHDLLETDYKWSLEQICEHELDWQAFRKNGVFREDPRPNHLSPVTTAWFLQHILARLENDQFIEWNKSDTPKYASYEELVANC